MLVVSPSTKSQAPPAVGGVSPHIRSRSSGVAATGSNTVKVRLLESLCPLFPPQPTNVLGCVRSSYSWYFPVIVTRPGEDGARHVTFSLSPLSKRPGVPDPPSCDTRHPQVLLSWPTPHSTLPFFLPVSGSSALARPMGVGVTVALRLKVLPTSTCVGHAIGRFGSPDRSQSSLCRVSVLAHRRCEQSSGAISKDQGATLTAVGSFTGTFCGTPHDNLRPGRCTFPQHVLPRDTPETVPAA